MQVKFKVKPKNGVEEIVQAELVDVIAWEEKFERPSSQLGGNDIFARDFVWLAWHAQKRQGKTTLDFMDWVATLDEIEGSEDSPLDHSENPAVIG